MYSSFKASKVRKLNCIICMQISPREDLTSTGAQSGLKYLPMPEKQHHLFDLKTSIFYYFLWLFFWVLHDLSFSLCIDDDDVGGGGDDDDDDDDDGDAN